MKDSLYIGESPADEPCSPVINGEFDSQRVRAELNALIHQLRRMHGDEPEGARLKIKSENNGEYLTVYCDFDDNFPESVEYAFKCESDYPEHWDKEALKELNTKFPGEYH